MTTTTTTTDSNNNDNNNYNDSDNDFAVFLSSINEDLKMRHITDSQGNTFLNQLVPSSLSSLSNHESNDNDNHNDNNGSSLLPLLTHITAYCSDLHHSLYQQIIMRATHITTELKALHNNITTITIHNNNNNSINSNSNNRRRLVWHSDNNNKLPIHYYNNINYLLEQFGRDVNQLFYDIQPMLLNQYQSQYHYHYHY